MAKRIILLLDGTWNDQDIGPNDTNIVRLQQIIAESLKLNAAKITPIVPSESSSDQAQIANSFSPPGDMDNIVFYERGVGTGGLDRFRGGVFGEGLQNNIRRAYKFLSFYYEPGDKIFIFGFSRGAYTARSVTGYIAAAGLLKRSHCTTENETAAWSFYRTPPDDRLPALFEALTPHVHDRSLFKIQCVGVFDTVGALGIPLQLFRLINRDNNSFHDVNLSSITKVNLHALAIDEHREPFEAAIWRKPKFKQYTSITEQVWFSGAHADVGGSYIPEERRREKKYGQTLDDITLDWMMKRVKNFYPDFPIADFRDSNAALAQDPPNDKTVWKKVEPAWAAGTQHEPRKMIYRLMPFSLRSLANRPVPSGLHQRNVCHDRHAEPIAEMVHISALQRIGKTTTWWGRKYGPANLITVLPTVGATYGASEMTASLRPPVLVVGWDRNPINPGSPEGDKVLDLIRGC